VVRDNGPVSRTIPDPGFAGDSGAADPRVSAALATYAADRSSYPVALSTLQSSRVLVPVVALLGEVEYDDSGLAHDKTSDMAAVLMQGADGRMALLAFTCLETLRAWRSDARPVPVTAQVAAQSALQDEAAALVVDIAGPVPFVVQGADLEGLARGWVLAQVEGTSAWIRADGP
jgi:hypothetical protein